MLTEAQKDKLTSAVWRPFVRSLELWNDGLEVCGDEWDQDNQAAFVEGSFDVEDIKQLFPKHSVTDNRG